MYNHNEAYAKMLYQCEDCKNIEVLWNSRDGVTPFIIACSLCDSDMQHICFELDVRLLWIKPEIGMRIFIDCPRESF